MDGAPRLRALASAAAGSAVLSYLVAVAVAAVAGLTASEGPAPLALLVAGVPLWLAAHQVPLLLDGAPLGVLPLLPTIGAVALTARFAGTAIDRLGGRWGGEAAWVVCALAGTQASLAVLTTALPLGPTRAEPWAALLGAGLTAAAGATAGVLRTVGAPDWWWRTQDWLHAGLVAAAVGTAALGIAGALLLFAGLAASVSTVHAGFLMRPGLGASIGVTVIAVCYLPNALVAAVGWLAGPGVTVGAATTTPTAVSVGPLPPLPLLAAMPVNQPPGWAAVVFALPVAVGVVVGLVVRRVPMGPVRRLRAVAVAAATVAAVWAVLAWVSGGRLAGGPFDPVDLPALSGALALLGWLGVPAMVTVVVPARPWVRRRQTLAWTADGDRGDMHPGARPSEDHHPSAAEGYPEDHEAQGYPEGFEDDSSWDGHDPDQADDPDERAWPDGGRSGTVWSDERVEPRAEFRVADGIGPMAGPRADDRSRADQEAWAEDEAWAESQLWSEDEAWLHEGRLHEGRAHEGRAHEGRAHEGRAHEGRAHEGWAQEEDEAGDDGHPDGDGSSRTGEGLAGHRPPGDEHDPPGHPRGGSAGARKVAPARETPRSQ